MIAAIDTIRIEHHEMYVSIIVGIIMRCAGSQAATFCVGGHCKNFIVGNIVVGRPGSIVCIFVVTWHREDGMIIENIVVINIEEIKGVFGLSTCIVGIITQHY